MVVVRIYSFKAHTSRTSGIYPLHQATWSYPPHLRSAGHGRRDSLQGEPDNDKQPSIDMVREVTVNNQYDHWKNQWINHWYVAACAVNSHMMNRNVSGIPPGPGWSTGCVDPWEAVAPRLRPPSRARGSGSVAPLVARARGGAAVGVLRSEAAQWAMGSLQRSSPRICSSHFIDRFHAWFH